MKLFYKGKDGGPESNVTGYWLVEIKSLFSIAILKFDFGTREAFHSHAFNCISWVLKGMLKEEHLNGQIQCYCRSFKPIITKRTTFHKVFSYGGTWVLTFRGPWVPTWKENIKGEEITLTNGRKIISNNEKPI